MRSLILCALVVDVARVSAQAVTLPTMRVATASQIKPRLYRLIDESASWSTSNRDALDRVRYRFLAAPLDADQLRTLACAPSASWPALLARELTAADADRTRDGATIRSLGEALPRPGAGARLSVAQAMMLQALPIPRIGEGTSAYIERASRDAGQRLGNSGAEMQNANRCVASNEVSLAEVDAVTELLTDNEADPAARSLARSLGALARRAVLERETTKRFFFPVRSREEAKTFWKQEGVSPLNVASVTANQSTASAYTELASPLLHAVRLSLSSVVAASSQGSGTKSTPPAAGASGDNSALAQFVSGGGQVNIGAAWPVFNGGTATRSFHGMLLVAPRLGGTLSSLGSFQQDATAFADGGVELHLSSVDSEGQTGLYLESRSSITTGGPTFRSAVGVPKTFGYATFVGGLVFGNKYIITASRFVGGPRVLSSVKWQVGVSAIHQPE